MSFPAQSFLYFIQVLTVSRGITPYYYKANSLVLLLYHLYLSLVIERFPIKPSFFAESGCKDKDFLTLLPNFSPSFFSKLPRSAASVPESGCKSIQNFQGAPLPFPKAGAKVRTFPITANRTGTFLKGFLYLFYQDVDFQRNKNSGF